MIYIYIALGIVFLLYCYSLYRLFKLYKKLDELQGDIFTINDNLIQAYRNLINKINKTFNGKTNKH